MTREFDWRSDDGGSDPSRPRPDERATATAAALGTVLAHTAGTGGGAYLGAVPDGWVWSGREHAALVLGPPRSGKTSAVVIPSVVAARGAVVCTSTKPDIAWTTAPARRQAGPCLVYDPTGSVPPIPGIEPVRWLREFRLPGALDLEEGSLHRVEDAFAAGDLVDVIGTSKGKGFQGAIRRWGFHRGPMTHGSKYHRGPGSLNARMSGGGGRVFKGRKLPGHMGHRRVTVLKLRVERVDPDRNLLMIRGAIPGPNGSLVMVRESVRSRATARKEA